MQHPPALVIMAAGMGSRYGGLKQMDAVGPSGETIIDYSIYDAQKAGFGKVVFVIKQEIRADFERLVGAHIEKRLPVSYAFQELSQLPAGYAVPEGRQKPWGTTHAVLAAAPFLSGPFAVINADDYYGPQAYRVMASFLAAQKPQDGKAHYAMVGYQIENTVTDKGTVARGICNAGENGYLAGITERTKVAKTPGGAQYTQDNGASWTPIAAGTLVSMNFWGLDQNFLQAARRGFSSFLGKNLAQDPQKCEYLLPQTIDGEICAGNADVKVLKSRDVWYGVTYREDKPQVVSALMQKHQNGQYPTPLWPPAGHR